MGMTRRNLTSHNKIYKVNGMHPDGALEALKTAGLLPENASITDMWKAVKSASDTALSTGRTAAEQAQALQRDFTAGQRL